MVTPDEMAEEKRRPTILGFLSGNPPQLSRDVARVSFYILLFFLVGLSFVVIQEWAGKPFSALLWAFACFSVGALIGFLFGIPRVLQQDVIPVSKPAPSGVTATSPTTESSVDSYSLKVNTNLEQISDWLTKIFVGLGLVQLQRVPQHLDRAATYVAYGLSGSKFFAGALIVYFSILGFLGFYLITRLYIAGAFGRADREAARKREDEERVERIPIRLDSTTRPLSARDLDAARNLVSHPLTTVSSFEELWRRAKAHLSLGNYSDAIKLYRDLVDQKPDDPRLHFEYGVALFYQGARDEAYKEILEAYKRITPEMDLILKKNIYRALTFQSLYFPPPTGFQEAIKFGEEYVRDARNPSEPAIWTNLASAYGQRELWYQNNQPADPQEQKRNRSLALDAVKKAAEFGDRWKNRLRELMQKDYPNKDPQENDLEVFENDREFRQAVGLPT